MKCIFITIACLATLGLHSFSQARYLLVSLDDSNATKPVSESPEDPLVGRGILQEILEGFPGGPFGGRELPKPEGKIIILI